MIVLERLLVVLLKFCAKRHNDCNLISFLIFDDSGLYVENKKLKMKVKFNTSYVRLLSFSIDTVKTNLNNFGPPYLVPLPAFLQEQNTDRVRLREEVFVAQIGALHRQLNS